MGTNALVRTHVENVVKEKGAGRLARLLVGISDKQAAVLIATKSMTQKICFPMRVLDIDISVGACSQADQAGLWMLERVLEQPAAAGEGPFFSEGCSSDLINLLPHQLVQAGLSPGTRGLVLALGSKRRLLVSIGSLAGMMPKVLVEISGPIGERVRTAFSAAPMIGALAEVLR